MGEVAVSSELAAAGRRAVDAIIGRYDEAWNTPDAARRRQLLEEALTEDCELVEPRGRFDGREAIVERISGFHARLPRGEGRHHDERRRPQRLRAL